MRNFFKASVAAVALTAFAGTASANNMADMPTYWNGFYIGGQTGYYDAGTYVTPPGVLVTEEDGVMLGGYAGYNHLLTDNVMIGIEGDFNAALGGKKSTPWEIGGLGSIRGRLGYAMDETLFYVTGGLGFITYDATFTPFPPGFDDSEIGFAVGGGVEHFLNASWSIKGEYLYMQFDDILFSNSNLDQEVHSFRLGVAFHF